ncbi:MAG: M48 family metallopeptidase [Bacteroidetes bacterium]|nr:M48 family metallopeptidase [Bacteroidota bacterium]
MENTIYYVIIAFIVLDYAFERTLGYLNYTKLSNVLPEELKGIYEAEKYKKSQDYLKINMKFGLIISFISFIIILLMLFFGGFGWLDGILRQYTNNTILLSILFFAVIGIASDIMSTPFDIYDTFVIEEKFGFNKTTVKTFILDKIKGWFLAAIIGGGLIAAFVWFYEIAGNLFWLYAWVLFSAFSIFMTMFYSTLIVPLFNKQTPLEQGELRDAIESFAKKAGFKLDNIFVIDGSKRSTKANAYFSGLGPKKRIVLYDTLIKDHTTEELVAVLAHEIGHYKMKHTLKGMFISLIHTALLLYLLGVFINYEELSLALGGKQSAFHLGVLAFGLLYSPISTILGIIGNVISRKHEYQADEYAAINYKAAPLQDALKKLSVNNLSNLRPHSAVVFVSYSHPPLLKRLEFLSKFEES